MLIMIYDGLYLGDWRMAHDEQMLKRHSIGVILNMCPGTYHLLS
jgi:hypothetical protein